MAYIKYIFFLFAIIDNAGAITCGANEYMVRCGRPISCQPTCVEPDRIGCLMPSCVKSCECEEGYIRATNKDDGNPCIKIDQCQNETKSTCGINEQLSDCANPCQPSCTEPKRQPCPTFTCSKGCVCEDGFIRTSDDVSSVCMANDQCP